MLIQKKTSRKQLILVAVVIAIAIAIYFVFFGQQPDNQDDFFDFPTTGDRQFSKIELDLSIFKNPHFLSLVDRTAGEYSKQHSILARGADFIPQPSNIKVYDPQTGEKLIVTWQNPTEDGYQSMRIYRSEKSGKQGEIVAEGLTKIESYEDFNITRATDYYYLVKAVKDDGLESENLEQVKARAEDKVAPSPPINVTLKNATDQLAVEISWENPRDNDFDHLKIYRSTKQGVLGSVLYDQKTSENKYIDQKVEQNQTYYYTITSVDTSGNESLLSMVPEGGNVYIFQPIITE